MHKKEKFVFKIASFSVASCILLSFLIPFAVFLLKNEPPDAEEYTIRLENSELNQVKEIKLEEYVPNW